MNNLQQQIEDAFHYRGHVTITLNDNAKIQAFLYNREFDSPALTDNNFIEVFLAGTGTPEKYYIKDVKSVEMTGEDCAAGKSYQEWLDKQANK